MVKLITLILITLAGVNPVDGRCPITHPVKAQYASVILYNTKCISYDNTSILYDKIVPHFCYSSLDEAASEGCKKSKI